MGRSLESKQKLRGELETHLAETQMVMVIEYANLTVAEITKLRRQLRPSGTVCKVTKNTLMKKAIANNPQWQSMETFLKGANVCLLVKQDIAAALKAYAAFQKEAKKTELRGGVLEGRALNPKELQAIADLPSKEVLIAQVAGAINGVATKLALAVKEVPQSLGRAIKAIADQEAA